jgi:UDP-N-acetylmuramoyl-L-alanyl-D-glutamate--2,6-diaminopimelate ligase
VAQTLTPVLEAFLPKAFGESMEKLTLRKLLAAAFAGEVPALATDPVVRQVTADSRKVRSGAVFVAVPGTAVDGARYAAEAVERGAVAVVSERRLDLPEEVVQVTVPDARAAIGDLAAAFHGHPSRDMTVVGITGTNGKTSTSLILRSIFECAGHPTAVFGTILYEIGARKIPATTTTPDPESLLAYLREARDAGIRHAVMEVSSHALVQKRIRPVEVSVGVFTNLAPEHLDYHRSLAEYRAAKALLFEGLAPSAAAVLNAEDAATPHIEARSRAGRTIRFGTTEPADVRASEIRCDTHGISFFLHLPNGGEAEIRSPLLGRVNVLNCLAAAAAAHTLDISLGDIRDGIASMRTVPGRLEPVDAGQPFTVLVDYAHTDHALRNVLESIRSFAAGRRIITVMGCGGDRDRLKRPRMGRAAVSLSHHVVVTSDNPRTEDPMAIIQDIRQGLTGHTNFEIEPDRRKAIAKAIAAAGRTDIVLVAGKGHETYQIVSGVVLPFDDRQVVREEIGRMGGEGAGR